MRWPWVSREAYDLHARVSSAAILDAGDMLAREQKRYDVLLEKYHALKLKGAEVPAPVVPVVPDPAQATPLDSSVALFLDAKFVRGTPLWRQQMGEALKLAAAGAEPERIIDTLGKGQTVEF